MICRENRFHEEWVEHRCSNGLQLVLFHKPDFITNAFLFLTPFGSLDRRQIDESGRYFEVPSGTAHFLEHKLFESASEDVMTMFSRMGANVNASTSYESTSYYFTTPEEEIEAPLDLLLDFVQDLHITRASVEKEKHIIREELAMYLQDPDSRLFLETMRALYAEHPIRDDIVGTHESIQGMTVDDLRDAYTRNYHPSHMTLIAVSPHEPQAIIDIVERNQAAKKFAHVLPFQRVTPPEAPEVNYPYAEIPMAIEHPRAAAAFKLRPHVIDPLMALKREWELRFALETTFSPLNPEYQEWIDSGMISAYFTYDIDCSRDYSFLYFQDEIGMNEGLMDFVLTQCDRLRHRLPDPSVIEQMKRRMIGSEIRLLDNPADRIAAWSRGILRNVSPFEEWEILDRISAEDCGRAVYDLNVNHSVYVNLVPENQ